MMVRRGLLNSRMRAFFEIRSLSRQFDFDGSALAAAIRETFTRRGEAFIPRPVAEALHAGWEFRGRWEAPGPWSEE
ncbi:hypothetical protein KJ682_09600 [bacterium]|nr:hypothetical protein [bacterium]